MKSLALFHAVVLLSVFTFRLPNASAEPAPPDPLISQCIVEIFNAGFTRGSKGFFDVEKSFRALKAKSLEDPRVDYAHGLALLRLLRPKEAKAAFLEGTKFSGDVYPPVWQALIWSNFIHQENEEGYDHLVELATRSRSESQLTAEEFKDLALWMGRVMAASELSLDSPQAREDWLQTDAKLTEEFTDGLMESYNGGKEEVYARHLVLEEDIRQTREKEKEKAAAQKKKKGEDLEKSAESAQEKRDSLKRTADEIKSDFAKQSMAFTKEMQQLEKDYALVERRGATLLSQMVLFDQQISLLQANRNATTGIPASQVIAAFQARRGLLETEFQMTLATSQQLAARAQTLMAERRESIEQYQQVTGEIVREEINTRKWQERSDKQAAELKNASKRTKGPTPALTAKLQAVTAFRTYCDLDPFLEREKVLATLGIESVPK